MFVLIRGAGDIATGIAVRLWRAGIDVALLETAHPTCIRRTVSFSEAVLQGQATVEQIPAKLTRSVQEAFSLLRQGIVPVLVDPGGSSIAAFAPDVLVDAILAKKNLGTGLHQAPVVIGVGPGFTAGTDCHAVVETQRGHNLGRVIYRGSAAENTGIPGNIGGYTTQRILRAPCGGLFDPRRQIGEFVRQNEIAAYIDGTPVRCTIDGVLRGILPAGTPVTPGFKCGDIDPRGVKGHCFSISDKARSVGGGVLEACLGLSGILRGQKNN